MALQATLRRVGRAMTWCRPASGAGAAGGSGGNGGTGGFGGAAGPGGASCRDARPPPPCQCTLPAPPPCRARPPRGPRALRVLCCAPPQGQRPPCAPAAPFCPLTCDHLAERPSRSKIETKAQQKCEIIGSENAIPCCSERDSVARQLEAARDVRRADYEREARERAAAALGPRPPPSPPPPTPHLMGEDRECACATDGRKYAVPCPGGGGRGGAAGTAPARCGPGRVPPPPSCVRLAIDDKNCRIKDSSYLDPCAHLPRVFIEIDRSVPESKKALGGSTAYEKPACDTSRPDRSPLPPVKNDLNVSPSPNGTGCPHDSCDSRCQGKSPGRARRAGDSSWCAQLRPPPPPPAPCRRTTPTELLRGRAVKPPGPAGTRPTPRCLHTSSRLAGLLLTQPPTLIIERFASSPPNPSADKLKSVLEERSQLREAALGRVLVPEAARPSAAAAGSLDLPVPAGVNRVSVRVTLENPETDSLPSIKTERLPLLCSIEPSGKRPTSSGGHSVLATCLEKIQEKISGCIPPPCKHSNSSPTKTSSCKPSSPCTSPPSPCKPNHSTRPPAPSKPNLASTPPPSPCKPNTPTTPPPTACKPHISSNPPPSPSKPNIAPTPPPSLCKPNVPSTLPPSLCKPNIPSTALPSPCKPTPKPPCPPRPAPSAAPSAPASGPCGPPTASNCGPPAAPKCGPPTAPKCDHTRYSPVAGLLITTLN